MSIEYYPLIFDLGSRFTRSGFVGDSQPAMTLPIAKPSIVKSSSNCSNDESTLINTPPYLDVSNKSLTEDLSYKLLLSLKDHPVFGKLCQIYQNDLQEARWIDFQTELRQDNNHLFQNLKLLINEKLLVQPKKIKLILIDNSQAVLINYILSKFLLFELKVKSIIFLPESIMTMVGANIRDGLNIDISWKKCTINYIYDLRILHEFNYESFQKFNGNTLHYKIIEKLIDLNDETLNKELLSKENLFDIVELFIGNAVYVKDIDDDNLDERKFEIIPGIHIPSRIRHEVIEAVFFSKGHDLQAGEGHLPSIIKECINRVPLDIRLQLIKNTVFSGGLSKIPGFKTRFLEELRALDIPAKGKITLGSWTGCSMYCSTSLLRQSQKIVKNHEITRDVMNDLEIKDKGINLTAFPNDWNSLYS